MEVLEFEGPWSVAFKLARAAKGLKQREVIVLASADLARRGYSTVVTMNHLHCLESYLEIYGWVCVHRTEAILTVLGQEQWLEKLTTDRGRVGPRRCKCKGYLTA